MPTTKLVCRVFDAEGLMLGWTAHEAAMRGDGMLRASIGVTVPIEQAGVLSAVSWHWADVNVETRVDWARRAVQAGEVVLVAQFNDPLIVCGPLPGPLPAVTLRQPVAIGIPVGQMGSRGAP